MLADELPIRTKLPTSIKTHFQDANGTICSALSRFLIENYWNKENSTENKQQYFSVVSETNKDTPADNRYAVFPQLSPRLPFLSFLVSCLLWIYKTKMSKGIRVTDSSFSTAITDLADYFHARQTLFCFFVCWYWAQCCAHVGGNELQQSMTVITFIDL